MVLLLVLIDSTQCLKENIEEVFIKGSKIIKVELFGGEKPNFLNFINPMTMYSPKTTFVGEVEEEFKKICNNVTHVIYNETDNGTSIMHTSDGDFINNTDQVIPNLSISKKTLYFKGILAILIRCHLKNEKIDGIIVLQVQV
ncbi:MAG: hypothetical protein HRT66_00875 [Flavobacteriaceae bacterium]|nr:hypothetical protein [Flavobacteriaceae bacterium]